MSNILNFPQSTLKHEHCDDLTFSALLTASELVQDIAYDLAQEIPAALTRDLVSASATLENLSKRLLEQYR